MFGLLAQDTIEQLAPMAEAGVIRFKCFLGRSTGEITSEAGRLLDGRRVAASLNMRVAFHAENDQILQRAAGPLQAAGRKDAMAHVQARPFLAEVESIQRAALFARETVSEPNRERAFYTRLLPVEKESSVVWEPNKARDQPFVLTTSEIAEYTYCFVPMATGLSRAVFKSLRNGASYSRYRD